MICSGVPKYIKIFSGLSICVSLSVFLTNFFLPSQYNPAEYATGFNFLNFNNETGLNKSIIPNLVHYVIFGQNEINFFTFLSLVSAIKIQNPDEIWIHHDMHAIEGRYWDLILDLSNISQVPVLIKHMAKPDLVFGQPLSSVYHSSDVARIIILQASGGIYLDCDTLILKPLNKFLKFEMVLGWPEKDYIGTQILIGHKDARFLKGWMSGYRYYKPRTWYYNAGIFPTELLQHAPHLIHRVREKFGVHYLVDKLHGLDPWPDWMEYYALHLLSRHSPTPEELDELVITKLNSTFSKISRWILYEVSPKFKLYSNPHWVLADDDYTKHFEI